MVYRDGQPISVDQNEFLVAKYQPNKQSLLDADFDFTFNKTLKIEPFYYNKPHVDGVPNILGRRFIEP